MKLKMDFITVRRIIMNKNSGTFFNEMAKNWDKK